MPARVPARTRILTDEQRQLPCGREPVQGTELDFRQGRLLGGTSIDSAFTELDRNASGWAVTKLSRPDGSRVELSLGEAYPFIEIFTADTLAPSRSRRGLGVEPMSCPPNAFQSGEGLVRLEPGQAWTGRWQVRLV